MVNGEYQARESPWEFGRLGYLALRPPPPTRFLPVSGQGHVQKVVLRVAVEGAAEAHCVLHPSLVHLQVESQAFSIVEHPHAHVGPHPQEHGGQPPDLKGIWAQNPEGDVGSWATVHPTLHHHLRAALQAPCPAQPPHTVKPCRGGLWGASRTSCSMMKPGPGITYCGSTA